MSLWSDKHRPRRLKHLDYHVKESEALQRLASKQDFPCMLFTGPDGSGKRTRVLAFLRELYGSSVDRVRIEPQVFETPSKKKVEIMTVASNFHVEMNPGDVGIHDRVVIQELVKTMASSVQLPFGTSSSKETTSNRPDFKVVVLNEVDSLTKDAQHALRRTMERYLTTCRMILVTSASSKVIAAIRSRCLIVRVAAPTNEQILNVLYNVAKKENLSLPQALAVRIAEESRRNLRRALLILETCKVQQNPLSGDQVLPQLDWEVYLGETAKLIVREQTPKQLLEIRGRLYELLVHCIDPSVIFERLALEVTKSCDQELKVDVIRIAAEYEHRLRRGSKPIFHLEAFVAKVMAVYMRYVEEGLDGDF